MGIFKLGLNGRLVPAGAADFLPDPSGHDGETLETDGVDVSWGRRLANKGFGHTVSLEEFEQGYFVMPSKVLDISSLRVHAVGSILQINEAFAADLPADLPDFAYREVSDEPRIYFKNVSGVTSGLSEAPDNLFAEGTMYIIYYETGL